MFCGNHPDSPELKGHDDTWRCPGGPLKKFIQPCLLLLLRQKPAHGYELMENLSGFGFAQGPDPGAVYRNLRRMEEDGLVKSRWETTGSGPPRRFYELTGEGEDMLRAWVVTIMKNKELLEAFIRRYYKITGEQDLQERQRKTKK